jgi:hypothetical protein
MCRSRPCPGGTRLERDFCAASEAERGGGDALLLREARGGRVRRGAEQQLAAERAGGARGARGSLRVGGERCGRVGE